MWKCPKCNFENKEVALMCANGKCTQIQPGKSLTAFSGGSSSEENEKPKERKYKNEYRPVINTTTGKGYLAKESYARKLEKAGTHKLAGDIVSR